ncbi:Extradiol ring-cleavage dioxygenase, class III enzyme, subunit B [Xylariaceae sp. FL0255]|nr:Extradiol ring-cleavage dioxygenase, class III enzyme, subunit B [Xylariaceae sp. FL0255]
MMESRLSLLKRLLIIISILVAIVAFYLSTRSYSTTLLSVSALTERLNYQLFPKSFNSIVMPAKAPVYFISHGGPNTMFETKHPVYPVLQKIGREITQKVKPKAVVVFSAHWEAGPRDIEVNTAENTKLIYDYYGFPPEYYKVEYPNKGSPEVASKVLNLLKKAGISAEGVSRGVDHGVFVPFSVAFHPTENPLNVPLIQVSQFNSEDPDMHYKLGQAVSALRDENIVVIGAGMSVHNLRDLRFAYGSPKPLPYAVSFDKALQAAMEAPPAERQAAMAEVTRRPDARQAHPRMEHLMSAYVAAGAGGEDKGKQIWTLQEMSMAWGTYRFGEVAA